MDCERFIERFPEDGAEGLDAEARRHLDACADCRRVHASYFRGCAVLRSLPSVPVSDDFMARLEHRIDHLESRRRARRNVGRLAGRLATAGATMALAYLVVAGALERLDGVRRLRGTESVGGVPSVRVVRPYTSFASPEVVGIFAAEADPARAEGAAGWLPLRGVAAASAATAGGEADAFVHHRRARSATPQPVLVATPSWTFAAAPASLHFVSPHPRPEPPTLVRTTFASPAPFPRWRAE